MKWTFGKAVLWIGLTISTAVAAFATGQDVAQNSGEQVMSRSCLSCHDVRPIDIQAMDADSWTALVNAMMAKGADVREAEVPVLVSYLAEEHGPLPEGAGKKILLNVCTKCHSLGRVKVHLVSREEWEETLTHMIGEGAGLTDEDFPVLLNYLSRVFPPQE